MSSQRIPLATPYPWAPNETQISPRASRRKRKGSGFSVVNQAIHDESTSKRAKEILTDLVGDAVEEESTSSSSGRFAASSLLGTTKDTLQTTVDHTLNDDTVLQMAKDGQVSLLGSILRIIRGSPSPVPTKQILRTCALAVEPRDVPGTMDAKEYVLAALHFLSSSSPKSEYWELPLIQPTADHDLEKRSYEAVAGNNFTEQQLPWLETAFQKSPGKYLQREKYCPYLKPEEEYPLLLKGTIPASATPKTAAARRRSPVPKASPY